MRNFGTDLTAWRKANAIKQEYLAQMLGVSQSAVSHWERGRDVPSAQTALRLQALMSKTSRDELAGEAQQMLSDGDTISGILSDDIVMASGVSVNHVDTAVDLEVFYKHRWHILFRKIGQRHVIY